MAAQNQEQKPTEAAQPQVDRNALLAKRFDCLSDVKRRINLINGRLQRNVRSVEDMQRLGYDPKQVTAGEARYLMNIDRVTDLRELGGLEAKLRDCERMP